MNPISRRAVITGIGVITPLGSSVASYWDALQTGRSGVRTLTGALADCCPTEFGAAIDDFDAKAYFEKKDRKRLGVMSRSFQLAAAASLLAVDDAGLDLSQLDPTRVATVMGAGTVSGEPVDFALGGSRCLMRPGQIDLKCWGQEGMSLVPPMWMLGFIPNMVGCHVSVLNNAQGPSNTITQTDLAGILALAEACRYLRRDAADVVLVGGGDSRVTPMSLMRHQLMQPMSRRNDAPERACRPFDRDRDGIVPGEGGGIFVVEAEEHARRRGARVYAEIVGTGATFDAGLDNGFGRWPRGAPSDRSTPYAVRPGQRHGLARAIELALVQAGITPGDLDHVNAHGLSAIADDHWEAQGLAAALGPYTTPVFAPKSYFGSMGAAGGPVELAASLLAMQHQSLPATLNYEHADPSCPVRVAAIPQPITKAHFLKVSFTELGQCAALVCRAPSGAA